MALDTTASRGREIVSYVRVGRGMVKVTKYENEQPKSPSDTTSLKSSHSGSSRSASTPGPSRGWLRRPRPKGPNKRAPSTHRSRSRSSVRSLRTIRRTAAYMHSENDVTTPRESTTSPVRRGRTEPQGLFPLNSLPIPGSAHANEPYDKQQNYPKPTPRSSTARDRRADLRITPPLSTSPGQLSTSNPSPSTLSWTTESEIDPVADSEMWSSISKLEDELVSRFGRGVVPQLSSLRQEKTSAPPAASTSKALPGELIAALQRDPSPIRNDKLKQRSLDPITISVAEPPRRVHRTKSSPSLAFPLPPPTMPDWVTNTPLPTPPLGHGLTPSSALMRAKAGPPPTFAPPPNFPPPPPPTYRYEARDMQKELDALVALYDVLASDPRLGSVKSRSSSGSRSGLRKPGEPSGAQGDVRSNRLKPGTTRPFPGPREGVPEEDEGDATPLASVSNLL